MLAMLSADPEKFRADLFNIARTTLSSKVLSQDKNYFANLAVDAVLRLKVSPQMFVLRGLISEMSSRAQRTWNISK